MKTFGTTWTVGAVIVAASWSWTLPVEAATKAEQARAAAKLVEETLRREATEGVDDRWELLKPALEKAPDCDAAYWQSGFVYDSKQKEWLRWDEVQQLAAKNTQLATYRQTREKYPETIDGQIGLARWCSKHKLEDQARAHLTRVLELDPNHAEARQHLSFRSVNGTWVDDRNIAEARTFARKASAAAAKWVPRLEKLRDRLASDNAGQREKARAELMAIGDRDAVDAIDAVFCRQTSEMALLGIESLKNIRAPQAAAVLAWHSVYSGWPQVRQAAATALRSQEMQDYVPLLLEAAQTAFAPQTQVAGSPSNYGSPSSYGAPQVRTIYRLDHVVNTQSWNTVEHLKDHPYWQQVPQMRFDPHSPNPVAKRTTDTVNVGGKSSTTQKREYYVVKDGRLQDRRTETKVTTDRQVLTPVGAYLYPRNPQPEPYQQQTEVSRYSSQTTTGKSASCIALADATGAKGPNSPSEWCDWWYEYNEVYSPSGKPSKTPNGSNSNAAASEETQAQRGDCIAAGTLVRAETGPTAVENVAVGDRVFCCDPETGCLALKPVLQKTVRPEGRLLKVRAGEEEFEASGGHVFWVAGRGWVKARDLREGMQLHTIRGTVPVKGVEPGTLHATFSLVVADFHTYFAGKENILTHDNTIRKPTNCVVPGLTARVATRSP